LPDDSDEQSVFFAPDLANEKKKHREFLETQASLLRRFLVHRSPIMPIGLLRFCIDYAAKDARAPDGILREVRERFSDLAGADLGGPLQEVYDFRNTYIAHSKDELDDAPVTEEALRQWIDIIRRLADPSVQLQLT